MNLLQTLEQEEIARLGKTIPDFAPGDTVVVSVNVVEGKKLTNMRASGSDGTTQIVPKIAFSLEEALEYIQEDEYVEVTPKSIRLRKILLDENDRKKAQRKLESAEA